MGNEIARVIITGDDHLSSKNRGVHNNYPEESLNYYKYITEVIKSYGCTHCIGAGDFTYGRFHTLEYRNLVEAELERRLNLVNGNYYMIKGNHDIASYGMTEYEFYLRKGLFKPAQNLQVGNLNINMVNFDEYDSTDIKIEDGKENIIITHGYFKFKDTMMPNYGNALILDEYEKWAGISYLICGHIHNEHAFSGKVIKGNRAYDLNVHYLPCLSRPDYMEGNMADTGSVIIIQVYDDNTVNFNRIPIQLLPLEASFNLALKDKEEKHKEAIKIDVKDVVESLDNFERVIGNPEDIINAKTDIDERYRKKAIELLQSALA